MCPPIKKFNNVQCPTMEIVVLSPWSVVPKLKMPVQMVLNKAHHVLQHKLEIWCWCSEKDFFLIFYIIFFRCFRITIIHVIRTEITILKNFFNWQMLFNLLIIFYISIKKRYFYRNTYQQGNSLLPAIVINSKSCKYRDCFDFPASRSHNNSNVDPIKTKFMTNTYSDSDASPM